MLENLEKIPLLKVKDLNVTFDILRGDKETKVHAVRGVSFTLNRGEVLGIVGESGSGKSVSTSAITGLLPANAQATGQIFYGGIDLLNLFNESRKSNSQTRKQAAQELRSYRGKKIGMIFQEPGRSFDPLQNIGSVFFETFRNNNPKITKEQAMVDAEKLLTETGIDNAKERLTNFPHQFSGGQLQRIGIALSLAQDCELLIADEPTTALDVTIQSQIVELLLKLRADRNISIIFISHNIDLVAQISDRIMVMYGGLIMETGHAKELKTVPKHPYTKALLNAAPSFGSHYSTNRLVPIPGKIVDPVNPEKGCPFYPRCSVANDTMPCKLQLPELRLISAGITDSSQRFVRCINEKGITNE